jgi:phytoene dehydrogenase-like protein
MGKSVVIIGAGVAGLSVGCYLRMNGYDTTILEANAIPGGLCTGWVRGDYTFDGCIHWLAGSGPASGFYPMWRELVDIDAIEFVDHDLRFDIELDRADRNGDRVFHVYADLDRLGRYMLDIAPEDARLIDEFCRSVRQLQRVSLPPLWDVAREVRTWRDKLKLVRYLPLLDYARKWSRVTNYNYAQQIQNPFLAEGFRRLFMGKEFSLLGITLQLALYDQRAAGYPVGGSLGFARKLADRYEALGGAVRYRARVAEILVEDDAATGIRLQDGEVVAADAVISAADGHFTLYEALGGRYVNQALADLYDLRTLEVYESLILVSLGVARTFEGWPHLLRFPLDEPLTIADGTRYERMEAHVYNYDPTLAPEGKTVVSVTLYTRNHPYWTNLREHDRAAYQAAKDDLAREVIARLDRKFGDFADVVEVVDVATPATVIRYTHNWQGSYQGWYPPADLLSGGTIPKTLPGLRDFYMIGQWVEPGGGLPPAALSGRNVAQILCVRDGVPFTTTSASRDT